MSKLLCGSVAAVLLGLSTLTGAADAARGPVNHVSHAARGGQAYHTSHGVRFSGGYYYRGHDHNHWTRRAWDSAHRRWQFWDPYCNCYYYWYAPGNCYYPVTYCP